jgi:RNA polymerase sigma factor for flagellar operon FliA
MLVGDKKDMFIRNIHLVGFVVRKIVGFGKPPDPLEHSDLVQLGMIGLLDAVERFDPARGVQFQTYAVSRIRGTIQDELRKLDWVPRSVRKQERTQEVMFQQAAGETALHESHEETAQRLSMSMDEYRAMIINASEKSPDSMVALEDRDESNDQLATSLEEDPSEMAHRKQVREAVYRVIHKLDERDRLVLVLYYYEELTFKEIGRILRISESRAYQIHEAAIQHLRKRLKKYQ